MEYLEGEPLATRLERGALTISEALTIGIQVASALDKAHRAGIVHRDLKPGNVMLCKGGAKLLDFGLANARTDIFAFGAVLYEMLTGKKAFEGKTHASLIGAIMHADPPPASSIQPLTPAALDRTVKTCLAKDPDDRWQSASDLTRELKWIAETGPQAAASTAGVPAAKRATRVVWILTALATVFAAAAIALGIPYLRSTPAIDVHPMRFAVSSPQNVTLSTAAGSTTPAVSPDGRRLAFVARRAGTALLWVRSLDSLDAQPLPGTDGATHPFWSPDSRTLGFFANLDRTLKTIDASGGPVRTI